MEVKITGSPKDIAALVFAVQGRQGQSFEDSPSPLALLNQVVAEAIGDMRKEKP